MANIDGKRGDNRGSDQDPPYPAPSNVKPGAALYAEPFVESATMNAVLARNWWAVGLRGVFTIIFGIVAVVIPVVTLAALVLLFAAYLLVDGIFAIVAGLRAAGHHGRWGTLIFEGIVDLIVSAIAFFWPLATVLAFVYLMGAWAIVSGVVLLSGAFRIHLTHGRWLAVFGGIVSIAWGILLLLWPFTGALVLTWWMGAYALFFGGALLVLAFRLRRRRHDLPSMTLPRAT
jgi:uncharacterized membrane protein HdeD (DUF308 family)